MQFNKIPVFKRETFERLLCFDVLLGLIGLWVEGQLCVCQSSQTDNQSTVKHFGL